MDAPTRNKARLAPLFAALRDFADAPVRTALDDVFAPHAMLHLCHPFGDLNGAQAFHETCLAPLHKAMPDLERRGWITMGGLEANGAEWVGAGGHYIGTFAAPFLGIPPTGHLAHMRFHEFYRMVEGRVVEVQAIWDLPELMMQAGVWPMSPSLGRELFVPGPATQDGLRPGPWDKAWSDHSCHLVQDMLTHMVRHPSKGGPEVMEMERFWHPRMNWYGPAGIGTARGIEGFRRWHQIPFLAAMPDRGQHSGDTTHHFFGDGDYVAVTGWPNMRQTITGDGWLGIAPSGREVTLRSLDFWRIEGALIRENWVMVDLLDMYAQLDVDVLGRMRQIASARPNTGALG